VSLSGKPDMHAGFGLPFPNFKHTEFPHYYRRHEPGESEEQFSARMADALDELIQAEGPDTIAAFFAEPVMGAGGGIIPPRGYFEKIQAVLRKYDILFVADEVICGFARTGEMWGSKTFGIRPDMMTSAKALSAAMLPISAVIINDRIHNAMLDQSDKYGNFAHGFTYAGHPVSAAVALEVQKIYQELDIVSRAKRLGAALQATLEPLRAHRLVGDMRGVGFIVGLELMRDGEKRIPFDPSLKVGAMLDAAAMRHGQLRRLIGDRVVFAPPLVIEENDIGEIGERMRHALDEVAAELPGSAAMP
jgi:4-aminobutyrate--pyruvate transaminase